jgi:hypothetical protein
MVLASALQTPIRARVPVAEGHTHTALPSASIRQSAAVLRAFRYIVPPQRLAVRMASVVRRAGVALATSACELGRETVRAQPAAHRQPLIGRRHEDPQQPALQAERTAIIAGGALLRGRPLPVPHAGREIRRLRAVGTRPENSGISCCAHNMGVARPHCRSSQIVRSDIVASPDTCAAGAVRVAAAMAETISD